MPEIWQRAAESFPCRPRGPAAWCVCVLVHSAEAGRGRRGVKIKGGSRRDRAVTSEVIAALDKDITNFRSI